MGGLASVECFLCRRPTAAPQTQPLPDSLDGVILAPLCAACRAQPLAVRINACLTRLRDGH